MQRIHDDADDADADDDSALQMVGALRDQLRSALDAGDPAGPIYLHPGLLLQAVIMLGVLRTEIRYLRKAQTQNADR
jgi:hypothetical protein